MFTVCILVYNKALFGISKWTLFLNLFHVPSSLMKKTFGQRNQLQTPGYDI